MIGFISFISLNHSLRRGENYSIINELKREKGVGKTNQTNNLYTT